MSIVCSDCGNKEGTFRFIGYLSGQALVYVQNKIQVRGLNEDWDDFMAGAATGLKMPCSGCKKEVIWRSEHQQVLIKTEKQVCNEAK